MKIESWVIGLIVLTFSYARAESISAPCSLEVKGRKISDGKCCLEQSAIDGGTGGFLVELSAKSLEICVYESKYPEQDDVPIS